MDSWIKFQKTVEEMKSKNNTYIYIYWRYQLRCISQLWNARNFIKYKNFISNIYSKEHLKWLEMDKRKDFDKPMKSLQLLIIYKQCGSDLFINRKLNCFKALWMKCLTSMKFLEIYDIRCRGYEVTNNIHLITSEF